jgi:hypothetical protein
MNVKKERVPEKNKRLQALFPLLADETQSYMLGLAQGLKTAQETGLITAQPYRKSSLKTQYKIGCAEDYKVRRFS